jgi:glycosyltransferase involved in cell wall biosynthesis
MLSIRVELTLEPAMHALRLSARPPDHVHILMGSCNGARWIGAQLDSFLAQTHPHWSLWVSDDGSSDDTRALIEEFANRNPGRVERILDGPRRGSAANFLYLLCHPDLPSGHVALSDQDDVWLPHKLARAMEQLHRAGPDPCVWAARYMISDEELRPCRESSVWERGPSLGNAVAQNILSGHTLTLNPAALALLRRAGPVAVPHHDWWIYLLIEACGARILVDTQVVLHYRQHGANTMGFRLSATARRARLASLMQGQLRGWIDANLQALAASDLPLTHAARTVLLRWREQGRRERLRLMREIGIHRQSRLETALLHLTVALGRL